MVRPEVWAPQTRLGRHGRDGDRRPAVHSLPQLDPAGTPRFTSVRRPPDQASAVADAIPRPQPDPPRL